MKGPRTYVGAALDEIARKRLRRARLAAVTERLHADNYTEVRFADNDTADVVCIFGSGASFWGHHSELPYPDGPLASRKVDP